MKTKIFLRFALLAMLSSCISLQQSNKYPASEQLVFPSDRRYNTVGLVNNQVVVFHRDQGKLYYAFENDLAFSQVPDKRTEFCPEDDFYKILSYSPYMTVLQDQRLGLIGACSLNEHYMFAYDFETGKMEKIVEQQLPVPANNFSWNPTMTRGVQDSYTHLAGTIFWLDSGDASAMDVVLKEGNQSWSLATDFPHIVGDGRQGIAAYPVWSPDGKKIAFIATFDSIGKSGFSILDSEYSIYIMDAETLLPTQALDGVYGDYPITLAWSPDGKYLSFTGKYRLSKQHGLWILNLETKKVLLVDESVTHSVWRKDGKSIVGIKCSDATCDKQMIRAYQLGELP